MKHLRLPSARPGQIREAALLCFERRGFSATRLEDVATMAGVSKGMIYNYYSSKAALFAKVCEALLEASKKGLDELLSQPTSVPERIEALLDWRWCSGLVRASALLAASDAPADVQLARNLATGKAISRITQAAHELLGASATPPSAIAFWIVSAPLALAQMQAALPVEDRPGAAAMMRDLLKTATTTAWPPAVVQRCST